MSERMVNASLGISWLGHACFEFDWQRTPGLSVKILIDPFNPEIGYPPINASPSIVLITHPHGDHASVPNTGSALVLRGVTDDGRDWRRVRLRYRGMKVSPLATYHDRKLGAERGKNMGFIMQFGPIRTAHLGDLGHMLSRSHIEELSGIDLLMIPTGGHYTIDAATAREIVAAVRPRIAIPMHYRTRRIEDWPLEPLEEFTAGTEIRQVESKVTIAPDDLPAEPEIWVFPCP